MNTTGGMVDVGGKNITVRIAKARGSITLTEDAFEVVKNGTCIKGDVLATAKIAAIQAVKSTPSMIPLCHSILIEAVDVVFDLNDKNKSVDHDLNTSLWEFCLEDFVLHKMDITKTKYSNEL